MTESNYVVEENQRPKSKKKKDNGEKTKEKANREKGGEGGRKASTGDENG